MENEQLNIVEIITQTINNLFSNLFSSVDNSLYSILDDLLFINADIMNDNYLNSILGSSSSGIVLICNSLLIGLCMYYAIRLLLSHLTFSQVQKPSQFIFKLFLCVISMNYSYFIIKNSIYLISDLTLSIREVGETVFSKNICLSTFIQEFNSTIYLEDSSFNIFTLNGLLKSFVSVGFLNLAISYALRYIMIKVFIFISPFAFISLINPSTSWFFKAWLKLFSSLLLLQIFVSLILLVTFSINYTSSDIFSKIVYIGSIYSLIKANTFVREFMGGLSTDVSLGISSFKNLFTK